MKGAHHEVEIKEDKDNKEGQIQRGKRDFSDSVDSGSGYCIYSSKYEGKDFRKH